MNIKKTQPRIGFTPLSLERSLQLFKDSIEVEFNHWILGTQHLGSWKSVHKDSFPEDEINQVLKLWQGNKLKCLDFKVLLNDKSKKEILYSKAVEPTIGEISKILDKFSPAEKEKASVFASWIYTYGLSKLDLAKANTKLEQELNKRFNNIEIAPKLKHCCIGLCSACGKREIVYSCTNPIT